MQQIKTIDWSQQSFTANGKKYLIEKNLSISRAVYAEAAKMELESGVGLGKYTRDWQKVYDLMNDKEKGHFVDIAVIAYNHLKAFNNFFQNQQPILKYCCCFLNTEDEDRRFISDDLVNSKIEDFNNEGIAMASFFQLALSLVEAEASGLKNIVDSISTLKEQFREELSAGNLMEAPAKTTTT